MAALDIHNLYLGYKEVCNSILSCDSCKLPVNFKKIQRGILVIILCFRLSLPLVLNIVLLQIAEWHQHSKPSALN